MYLPSSGHTSSTPTSSDSRSWMRPQEHSTRGDMRPQEHSTRGDMRPQEHYTWRHMRLQGPPLLDADESSHSKSLDEHGTQNSASVAEPSPRPPGNIAAWPEQPLKNEAGNSPKSSLAALGPYRPLPHATSYRIIHILPGDDTDRIKCILSVIDLGKSHPSYVALSYVWGSQESPIEISCNNEPILVTQNLKEGLQRIRDKHRTKAVWVDAICINQSDEVERGKQVRLMRQIYHNAAKVLVWLGNYGSGHAERAFSTLRSIHNGALPSTTSITSGDTSKAPIDWELIQIFYRLQYFQRIWVLQEVSESSSATFIWGKEELSWAIVGNATYLIRNSQDAFSKLYDEEVKGLFNAYIMYRLPHPEFQPITFFDLLRLTSQFSATDKRDKVYAILGLPNQDSDPRNGNLFIEPDYTLSRNEVYKKVAVKIFESSSMPLNLLSAVDHGESICEDFPSWIPQWHNNGSLDLESHRQKAQNRVADGAWAKGMGSSTHPSITNHTLSAFGFQFDTITHTTEAFTIRGEENAWYHHTISLWLGNIPPRSNNDPLPWQNVAWTLLAGKNWYGAPISNLEDLWDATGPKEAALTAAWAYCRNRKLFLTSNGALGLGPAALKLGDKVCVLFGATIPFVLRQKNGVYRLAGGCYVHGVMDGELMDEWGHGKRTVDFFQIW